MKAMIAFSVWAGVVLVLVPGQASATVSPLVSLRWPLKPTCTGNEVVSGTLPARSRADCARQCSNLAACNRFCFSTTSGRCYVRVAGASSLSSLATLAGGAASLSSIVCSARCPSDLGYGYVRGQCVKVHSESVAYRVAKGLCSQAGGHLYHFRSLSMDKPVIQDAMTAAGLTDLVLWLGAEKVLNQLTWSDGCPLYDNCTLWNNGEPSHNENEVCVETRALKRPHLRREQAVHLSGRLSGLLRCLCMKRGPYHDACDGTTAHIRMIAMDPLYIQYM